MTLANGVANMGTSFFIPFFVQGVLGALASTSGNIMMPMMLAMIFASSTSGQFVSRRGKYWLNAMIGAVWPRAGCRSCFSWASIPRSSRLSWL